MRFSLSPFAPKNLVSRDGFGRPSPRQPATVSIQAFEQLQAISGSSKGTDRLSHLGREGSREELPGSAERIHRKGVPVDNNRSRCRSGRFDSTAINTNTYSSTDSL